MTELAMNTRTAESKMGSHKAARNCMKTSRAGDIEDRVMREAIAGSGEGQALIQGDECRLASFARSGFRIWADDGCGAQEIQEFASGVAKRTMPGANHIEIAMEGFGVGDLDCA